MAALTEFAGGLLLVLGLLTPIAGLVVAGSLVVIASTRRRQPAADPR